VRTEVVKRSSKEFELLAKRWMVERTFGWLNRYRRLSKDYELYTEISEAMIYGALIRTTFSRITS
jgi:putative transposase